MRSVRLSVYPVALAAMVLGAAGCISLPKFGAGDDVSVQRLDRVIDENPDNVHAQFLLGRSHLHSNEPAKAVPCFRKAIALKPTFAEAYDGLGVAYLDQEDYKAALRVYTDMKAKFPQNAAALEGLATASLGAGNLADSRTYAEQAVAMDPGSAQAARILGEVAYAEGRYGEAIKQWKRAADADPMLAKDLNQMVQDLTAYLQQYPE